MQSAFDANGSRWPRSRWFAVFTSAPLALCVVTTLALGIRIAGADPITTDTTSGSGIYNDPTNGLGSWIWEAKVSDNQTCLMWKPFVIPVSQGVTNACLKLTVDNEFTVFLDGRELGHGAEWRELFVFDLTPLLSAGRHVLLVKAFNSYSSAGMLLGLRVDLADGRRVEVKSDDSWRIISTNYFRGMQTAWFNDALTSRNIINNWKTITVAKADWPAATVEAPFGGLPWWTNPQNVNKMPVLLPIRVFFWETTWFKTLVLTAWLVPLATCVWLGAKLTLHRKEQWLLQRERSRIAMDIHDDLGSKITQLVLHGEVTQSELPADAKTRPQIDLICQDARDVLSVLDEVLWAVNPKRDDLREFTTYICGYAEQFLKLTPIQCFLDVDTEAPDLELNLPLRRGLLMVTKEAINNAVKHSGATELRLQIRCEHGRLTVALQDNGKGFDPVTAASRKRNGLLNMSQRMAELGGSCVIVSRPGEGCRIEFSAPLRQSRWHFWNRAAGNRSQEHQLNDV